MPSQVWLLRSLAFLSSPLSVLFGLTRSRSGWRYNLPTVQVWPSSPRLLCQEGRIGRLTAPTPPRRALFFSLSSPSRSRPHTHTPVSSELAALIHPLNPASKWPPRSTGLVTGATKLDASHTPPRHLYPTLGLNRPSSSQPSARRVPVGA